MRNKSQTKTILFFARIHIRILVCKSFLFLYHFAIKNKTQKFSSFFVFIARFQNHLSSIFSANNMYKVLLIFETLWYTMNVKNQKGVSLWKNM